MAEVTGMTPFRINQEISKEVVELKSDISTKADIAYANNTASRVDALEVMSGLSPESPVDGQTADLVLQEDSLTRAAITEKFTPRGVEIYDTFADVPNGETPRETDSGHMWRYPYDDGRVVVNNGRMTALSAGEYPEVSASAPISRMGARFVINDSAGTKTTSGTLSLNAWGDGGVAANGVGRSSQAHIGFTDNAVRASIRESENSSLSQIYWQFYEKLQPGVEYECEWWIFDDMTVVRCPDGSVFNFRHPAVRSVKGTFANWQIFVPASTSSVFELVEVWADTTPISSAVSADGAVAAALSRPITVFEDSPVRALTKSGGSGEIIKLSNRGQVAVSRGRSGDPAVQLGDAVDLVAGDSPVIRVKETGAELLGSQIHLNTSLSGPSIQEGNVHPEGAVTARLGSLYLYRGELNTIGGSLFVRTTGLSQANTGWVPAVLPQAPLATGNFATAASAINQRGKYHGKQAMTTTNILLVAHGPAPTDPWGDGQGNVVYTPA